MSGTPAFIHAWAFLSLPLLHTSATLLGPPAYFGLCHSLALDSTLSVLTWHSLSTCCERTHGDSSSTAHTWRFLAFAHTWRFLEFRACNLQRSLAFDERPQELGLRNYALSFSYDRCGRCSCGATNRKILVFSLDTCSKFDSLALQRVQRIQRISHSNLRLFFSLDTL